MCLHYEMVAEESTSATDICNKKESSLTLLQNLETKFGEEIKTAFESKCSAEHAIGHLTFAKLLVPELTIIKPSIPNFYLLLLRGGYHR